MDDPKGFRPEECDENLSPPKTQKKTGDDVKEAIDATVHEEGAEEEEAEEAEADEEDEEAAEEKAPRKSYKKMMIAKGSLTTRYADQSSMKKTKRGYKYKKMSDAAKQRPQASCIQKFRKAYELALALGKIVKSPSGKIPKRGTHEHTIIKGLMEIV